MWLGMDAALPHTHDLIILGGGLSGCLIALALAEQRPELNVLIVEAGEALGGNHIWSFFESDVAEADRWLVEPLICHKWQGYDVRFPKLRRTLNATYCSVESERLDAVVRAKLGEGAIVRGKVLDVTPTSASLSSGQCLTARHIIDTRGAGDLGTLELGYQKFVGQLLNVPAGHGLTRPIIMDACVDQTDGYHFVYCLPFSDTQVFVEDTYYTNGAALDMPDISARIADYARAQGWDFTLTNRIETGVLPVVYGGDFSAYWVSTGADSAKAGVRAGMFHAMTGYSLPDAVRLASEMPALLDDAGDDMGDGLAAALRRRAARHWRTQGYYRLLGKMLFRAAAPMDRYKIFERFYSLNEALIGRFYAGQSHVRDKLRILMGKPPVPMIRALEALIRGR